MKDRGGGEGIGSRSNNLVYTKRQKQINAISTHETTKIELFLSCSEKNHNACLNGSLQYDKILPTREVVTIQIFSPCCTREISKLSLG